jgi:hypothetical protein
VLKFVALAKISRTENVRIKDHLKLFPTSIHPKYCKFNKVECSTSGKTCEHLTYGLKAVSRYNSLINANCELNRTIRKLKVSPELKGI